MDEMGAVNLPDCLIIEIFSRLPVKTLCRFKCVSKFFLTFIQEPLFVDRLRPKAPILWQVQDNNILNVYSIDCNGISTLKYECEFPDDFAGFYSSNGRYCNGLNSFLYNDYIGLCVCNVVTKQCVILPKLCNNCIVCFDSASQRYKVLGWVDNHDQMPCDFHVLTLGRDSSWRPVMKPPGMDCVLEPDAIINGEPFWMSYDDKRIISFRPADEEFRLIDLPNDHRKKIDWCCIFGFEGSLSLVEQHQFDELSFSLWILNDDVWVMVRKNITMPFQGTNLQKYYSSTTVGSWVADPSNFSARGGELLVAVVGDFDNKFLFIYSFLNNQFKRIKITGFPFCDSTMRNYVSSGSMMRTFAENYVSLQEWFDVIRGKIPVQSER